MFTCFRCHKELTPFSADGGTEPLLFANELEDSEGNTHLAAACDVCFYLGLHEGGGSPKVIVAQRTETSQAKTPAAAA